MKLTKKKMIELAEFMRDKLVEQGEVSYSSGGINRCMYRGPKGRKCAIGHLIVDEHYRKSFEGEGATRNNVMKAILASTGLTPSNNFADPYAFNDFFEICQRFHDAFAMGDAGDDDFSYIQKRFDRLIKELKRKDKSVSKVMEFMRDNEDAV